jgi:TrmH family RNA methyltransferase
VSENAAERLAVNDLVKRAGRSVVLLSERAFRAIVEAETPQGVAAEIAIPAGAPRGGDSAFLEGVQDAGNVGAIMRSAAAFGLNTVYLDKACADAWSPKVLRAGAGAHFALSIVQGGEPPGGKLLCAVAHGGTPLRDADLTGPLCWVFGAEGSGVSRELQAKARARVTVPASEAVESLNVAAAAAVCFYEAFSRRARGS